MNYAVVSKAEGEGADQRQRRGMPHRAWEMALPFLRVSRMHVEYAADS